MGRRRSDAPSVIWGARVSQMMMAAKELVFHLQMGKANGGYRQIQAWSHGRDARREVEE